MTIQFYNPISKSKQSFKPSDPYSIKLYVCGVTPYDYCHLGHARAFILYDVLVRHLQGRGYKVKYCRNITDVDDKIINKCKATYQTPKVLTDEYIKSMQADCEMLGCLEPTYEPRVSDYINEISEMITALISKGYAYIAENGDVYFDVSTDHNYGCLSHRQPDEQQEGERTGNTNKRNPNDFVLWKCVDDKYSYYSRELGVGRQGWHIECSALAKTFLGDTVDIHGGGADLKFPHHENEKAQSDCYFGYSHVNNWIHHAMVQVNDHKQMKMSKSDGTQIYIHDVLKQHTADTIRWWILSTPYRNPLLYSDYNLHNAKLEFEDVAYAVVQTLIRFPSAEVDEEIINKIQEALDDDLGTARACRLISEYFMKMINVHKPKQRGMMGNTLNHMLHYLGFPFPLSMYRPKHAESISTIEYLIKERKQMKKKGNYKDADEIRNRLSTEFGVQLMDSGKDTYWNFVRE